MFDFLTNGCGFGEILFMLAVAALLGWLLRHFTGGGNECDCGGAAAAGALSVDANDLKVVEGIGPKIEELLKADGVNTWRDLANTDTDRLQAILTAAGNRFKMHDPQTWAEQAEMAHKGQWEELKEYQDFLSGGRQ